jgi:hypothetical protein
MLKQALGFTCLVLTLYTIPKIGEHYDKHVPEGVSAGWLI